MAERHGGLSNNLATSSALRAGGGGQRVLQSRVPRVLTVLPDTLFESDASPSSASSSRAPPAYGVAFRQRLYVAADRASPLGVYTCCCDGPVEPRSKPDLGAPVAGTTEHRPAANSSTASTGAPSSAPTSITTVSESVWEDRLGVARCSRKSRPMTLRRGDRVVAEAVKDGWVRASCGSHDRWCPILESESTGGNGLTVLERDEEVRVTPMVPPGWEVLRLQDCSQDVLAKVIGDFEWGAESVAVRDVAAGRFVRVGTRRHGRAGDQLGEAVGVSVEAGGTVNPGGCAVLLTRRVIGVNFGGETFDALGLLQDADYLDLALGVPAGQDIETECREEVQRLLVAELRGWFSTPAREDSELTRAAVNDASALRRLWAGRLGDNRCRRLHECFRQLPRCTSGSAPAHSGTGVIVGAGGSAPSNSRFNAASSSGGGGSSNGRSMARSSGSGGGSGGGRGAGSGQQSQTQRRDESAAPALMRSTFESHVFDEEDDERLEDEDDPSMLWVNVALGSVLEIASSVPPRPGAARFNNLERLLGRAARTLGSAKPLSLHGKGPSQALVGEVCRSLDPIMESTPELGPACNELLLAFATASGSSFLAARVIHSLLSGADDTVGRACIPGVRAFWKLGSVLHFEARSTSPKPLAIKHEDQRRCWQFQELDNVGATPASTDRHVRSCLTLPFGEIPVGGVYWEVEVFTKDLQSMSLGVWLAHAQHFAGCCLADGSAVGLPGAKATTADDIPIPGDRSVFGVLLTDEDMTVTCDGKPFTRICLREMTRSNGAEAAIFIGQGRLSRFRLNIGQRDFRHAPELGTDPGVSLASSAPSAGVQDGGGGGAAEADVSPTTFTSSPAAEAGVAEACLAVQPSGPAQPRQHNQQEPQDPNASTSEGISQVDAKNGTSAQLDSRAAADSAHAAESPPMSWGRAAGSVGVSGRSTRTGSSPFEAFEKEPTTAKQVAAVLLGALARNASASVATDGGSTYRFGEVHRMNLEPDGMQVKRMNENAWAVVDCELVGADEAEWCFQSVEDLNNDEGTCYGLTTKPPQNSYDRDGWIVIRAYNAHVYVSGSDRNIRAGIQKIHPGSKVHFRLCLAEGALYGWVNDDPPVEILRDPSIFAGKSWYPACFVYGSRATIRLVSCWKSKSRRRPSSFALEISPRAVEMWVRILEDVVHPLPSMPRGSAGAAEIDAAAAQVLRVLVAQMQVAKSPWSAFGCVRERLKGQLQVLVIDRRDDPSLVQSQVLSCLLVEGLGVGELWGGPDEVLGVFLGVRGIGSRIEQTLAECLLEQRHVCEVPLEVVDELVRVAANDVLGGQILLRLITSAFARNASQFISLACGVLARVAGENDDAEDSQLASKDTSRSAGKTFFMSELLPAVSAFIGALPHREPEALPELLPVLELAARARCAVRRSVAELSQRPASKGVQQAAQPAARRKVAASPEADIIEGLASFTCGVAALMLQRPPETAHTQLPVLQTPPSVSADTGPSSAGVLPPEHSSRSVASSANAVDAIVAALGAEDTDHELATTNAAACSSSAAVLPVAPSPPVAAPSSPPAPQAALARAEAAVRAAIDAGAGAAVSRRYGPAPNAAPTLFEHPVEASRNGDRLPVFLEEVLACTGQGRELVCQLQEQHRSCTTGPPALPTPTLIRAQRALFVAAMTLDHAEAPSIEANEQYNKMHHGLVDSVHCATWRYAGRLLATHVRPKAQAIMASGGDVEAFEASVVSQLEQLARTVCPAQSSAANSVVRPSLPRQDPACDDFAARSISAFGTTARLTESDTISLPKLVQEVVDGSCGAYKSLEATVAAHRDVAAWKLLGLKLLRGLVEEASATVGEHVGSRQAADCSKSESGTADGGGAACTVLPLLPALQAALEDTLRQPLAGAELCGPAWHASLLRELVGLLREVHRHAVAGPPDAAALGVGLLCVPMAQPAMEALLQGHLEELAAQCLKGPSIPGAFQRSHAAALAIRIYLCSPRPWGFAGSAGRRAQLGPQLTPAFAQLLDRFSSACCAEPSTMLGNGSPATVPRRPPEAWDPLEVDWDLGAFGRLCPRRVDEVALRNEFEANRAVGSTGEGGLALRTGDAAVGSHVGETRTPQSSEVAQATTESTSGVTSTTGPAEAAISRYNVNYYCTIRRVMPLGERRLALEYDVVGDGSLGPIQDPAESRLAWSGGGVAEPVSTDVTVIDPARAIRGTLTFEGVPLSETLEFTYGTGGYSIATLHVPRNTLASSSIPISKFDELPREFAQDLALRCPPGTDPLLFDAVAPIQALCVANGREPIWLQDLADLHAPKLTALTLLRPVARLLAEHQPDFAKELLGRSVHFPGLLGALAWKFFERLTPESQREDLQAQMPVVMDHLRNLEAAAFTPLSSSTEEPGLQTQGAPVERCGSLALYSTVAAYVRAHVPAVEDTFIEALREGGQQAALACRLIGGPPRSPAQQLQVVDAPFGRALVVHTQPDHVKVLALQKIEGAQAVQRIRYSDLPIPRCAGFEGGASDTSWGTEVQKLVLESTKQALACSSSDAVDALRALRAVLPNPTTSQRGDVSRRLRPLHSEALDHDQQDHVCRDGDASSGEHTATEDAGQWWDAELFRQVVQELGASLSRGFGETSVERVELLEHRRLVLRLKAAASGCQVEETRNLSFRPPRRVSTASSSSNSSSSSSADMVITQAAPSAGDAPGAWVAESTEGVGPARMPTSLAVDAEHLGRDMPQTSAAARRPTVPDTVAQALTQQGWWRGKYKLDMGRNTWHKAKWQVRMAFRFDADGDLFVKAVWKQFSGERIGTASSWRLADDDSIHVTFSMALPERREAGRARPPGIFVFNGQLVRSRDCPVLEGRAEKEGDDCKYMWYIVPPEPITIIRTLGHHLGAHSVDLPDTHSVVSFSITRYSIEAGDLSGPLGLDRPDATLQGSKAFAAYALTRLNHLEAVGGPLTSSRAEREAAGEEAWTRSDGSSISFEGDDAPVPSDPSVEFKWTALGNLPAASAARPTRTTGGNTHGASQEAANDCETSANQGVAPSRYGAAFEDLRLREVLLVQVLWIMLATRPDNQAVSSLFSTSEERDMFFKCLALLPDLDQAFTWCWRDIKDSAELARDALRVAVEGVVAPFLTREVSKVVVQSDHNYHPNEEWLLCLHLANCSALRIRFDPRCKTELDRDYLQFFRDEACQERLHDMEKLSGDYPSGWPEVRLLGDRCWMKFVSNGSDEYWGWKFNLEGASASGGEGAAMHLRPALKLLSLVARAARDKHSVKYLSLTLLLNIAAALPEAPEVCEIVESMRVILDGQRVYWSDSAWLSALALLTVAETTNRGALLGSLVELMASQEPLPPSSIIDHVQDHVVLQFVEPEDAGLVACSRTTLVSTCVEGKPVRAFGFPLYSGSRLVPVFRVRAHPGSPDGVGLSVGVAACSADGQQIMEPVLVALPRGAASQSMFSVFAPGVNELQLDKNDEGTDNVSPKPIYLEVIADSGEVQAKVPLPPDFRGLGELVPVLEVNGFAGMLTLYPPLGEPDFVDSATARLDNYNQACQLLDVCRGRGRPTDLPPVLAASAWVLHDVPPGPGRTVDVDEALRNKCMAIKESHHPHTWSRTVQKLEVPGALAIEISVPRVELAEGCELRITCDKDGDIPVLASRAPAPLADSKITRYLVHGDYLYATLDNVDPHSGSLGTQQSHLSLPEGWELAPSGPAVVADVIARHPWGTHVLVCADGNAYSTALHEAGRRAGQLFNSNRLSVQRGPPVKYKPAANQFRILIRRSRPRPTGALPLTTDDLQPGERVVVEGSHVFIHGPMPIEPSWEKPPPDDIDHREELKAPAETAMQPILCPGPWKWALSATHSVTVMLQQGGDVKFLKTTLGMLSEEDLRHVNELMDVLGDGAVDPNATWVRAEQVRVARVAGSWDAVRQTVSLMLEGADDLGTVALAFKSTAEPRREDNGVTVTGEVEHRRWGSHIMEHDGRRTQAGTVASVWIWPTTHEPSIEVDIVETAQEERPGRDVDLKVMNVRSAISGGGATRALFLEEFEWVEEVHGDRPLPHGSLRLQVRTNKGRTLCWPPGPIPDDAAGRFVLKAPAGCEVIGLQMPAAPGAPANHGMAPPLELVLRPLALVRTRPAPVRRLPENLWDGTLQIQGAEPVAVTCQLSTTGSVGQAWSCEATVETSASDDSNAAKWTLQAERFNVAGGIVGTIASCDSAESPYAVQGRCTVAEDQHMHMTVFGSVAEDPVKWLRLRLQSSRRAALTQHGSVFIDGPTLVFRSADCSTDKYIMHAAANPWTPQIAADGVIVAEVGIERLGIYAQSAAECLIVGVAEPRPGGGTAPLGAWPGNRTDRWLWRGDGAISHGEVKSVQQNDAWRFKEGDLVGIAVGPHDIVFMRNGKSVHTVPKQIPGSSGGPLCSEQTPVFVAGTSCDAALRLVGGAQYPLLERLSKGDEPPETTSFSHEPSKLVEVDRIQSSSGKGAGDVWVEITPVGTSYRRSRRHADVCVGQVVRPGHEVVAVEVLEGWIRVARPVAVGSVGSVGAGGAATGRGLWLPLEKEGVGRLFQRKADVSVDVRPVFSCTQELFCDGLAPVPAEQYLEKINGDLGEFVCPALPSFGEPFTVEAWVRPSRRADMVVVAWGCPRTSFAINELCLRSTGEVDHSGLLGRSDIFDGSWHHIAATFDGRLQRVYVDFTLEASAECIFEVAPAHEKGGVFVGCSVLSDEEDAADDDADSVDNSGPPSPRLFEGSIQKLRIWAKSMPPAYLKAYAASVEGHEHQAIAAEAAAAVFRALEASAEGQVDQDVFEYVLGAPQAELMAEIGCDKDRIVSRSTWQRYCDSLWKSGGLQRLLGFLKALSHNVEQRLGRRVDISPSWQSSELPAKLLPRPGAYGWRVEAKPTRINDAMLQRLKGDGLDALRGGLFAARFALGGQADAMARRLVDRLAAERAGHDESWAEPFAIGDFDRVRTAHVEEALARAGMIDMSPKDQLLQVVAYTLRAGDAESLDAALKPPLKEKTLSSQFISLRNKAHAELRTSNSTRGCKRLVSFLMKTNGDKDFGVAARKAISEMFLSLARLVLRHCFYVLHGLNRHLSKHYLPFLIANPKQDKLVRQLRPLLLGHLRFGKFQRLLAKTANAVEISVSINRRAAATFVQRGLTDWHFRETLFGQVLRELVAKKALPQLFRQRWQARAFKVSIKGEVVDDPSTTYQQILMGMVDELQSRALPLLIPSPNARDEVGEGRDLWLLNPRAAVPECLLGFEFLGQLFGLAIRTGEPLPLSLAPFVWKGILGDQRTLADLRGIDALAHRLIGQLSRASKEGVSASSLGLTFAHPGVTDEGELLELVQGGRERLVATPQDAGEFAFLLQQQRLTCDELQLLFLRRGLAAVVPAKLLRLWTWQDLRHRVCGATEVDVEALQRNTRYANCSASDDAVRHFWAALGEFTLVQRQSFIAFAWARRSLPGTEAWETQFTLELAAPVTHVDEAATSSVPHEEESFGSEAEAAAVLQVVDPSSRERPHQEVSHTRDSERQEGGITAAGFVVAPPAGPRRPLAPDTYGQEDDFADLDLPATEQGDDLRFPFARTCTFTLVLPAYSSAEVCRRRLLSAMGQCPALDEVDSDADEGDGGIEEDGQREDGLAPTRGDVLRWVDEDVGF